MKIGIIHFSDIHIKSKDSENSILHKSEKLIKAVQNYLLGHDQVVLVISGDIAFSGKDIEYDISLDYLSKIKSNLEKYINQEIVVVGIPGNHDCDFSFNQKSRELIINGLEGQQFTDLDDDIINQCCQPQSEYFKFEEKLFFSGGTIIFHNKLLKIIEYNFNEFTVVFNCFNTSWTSKLKEQPGHISFPVDYFKADIFDTPANLRVNIIHHPLNWQSQYSHRILRGFLNKTGDVTLSGHEHERDITTMIDLSENKNIFIESSALQDSDNANNSSFNFISLNLSLNTYKVYLFNYITGNYVSSVLLNEKSLLQSSRSSLIKYSLKHTYLKYLDSLSAPLLHKRVGSEMTIEDVFVSPYLRSKNEDTEKINIVNFNTILTQNNIGKTILIGDEISGKTTLCKILYKKYYHEGWIPILIKGNKILKPNIEYIFHNLLRDEFADQYHDKYLNEFTQIDKTKIIIIIDDFHSCELKDEHRNTFTDNLNTNFNNILYTSNSLLYFNIIPNSESHFSDYSIYNILEHSYELKYELIQKWNALGENELFGNSLLQKNEEYDQQISYFLGKNFLPHYPLIILTALQSIDFGTTTDQGFSYYYKHLIEESIRRNVKKPDNFQFYNYFLSEFCFFLFENRLTELSKDSFEQYFQIYTKKQSVRISFNEAFDELVLSKIIRQNGDFVKMSYNYIYYYFVANYLSNNIENSNIKSLVNKLIERLYVDEFSSIIVFLTQISSSIFIIEALRTQANIYFETYEPARLEGDINHIDKLINSVPQLILDNRDLETNRKQEIARRNDAERRDNQETIEYKSEDYNLNEDVASISLLNTFVRAIKTFEIFGQVIKKNWGAYDGAKKMLYVDTTFSLAMRTLSAYIDWIGKDAEEIIEHVYYVADKRNIKNRKEIEKLAKKFIFHYAYVASHGVIKRISNSISHKQLKQTIDDLVVNNGSNAYKLVRLSIMMDHFGSFPNDEIKHLLNGDKDFKKYILPRVLLQNFIRQYLHFYDIPHDERNKICALAGIKIQEQRQIQKGSKEKKK